MSYKVRMNRLEREFERILQCEVCGSQPRTVEVAVEAEKYSPPSPCRGCGSRRFVLLVAGFRDPLEVVEGRDANEPPR